MTAARRRSLLTVLIALVITGLLVAGRLGRKPRGAATRAPEAKPSQPLAAGAEPKPAAAAPGAATTPNSSVAPGAAAPAAAAPAEPAAPANVVARQMRALDASDRALLAEFERAGSKWPAGVAGELIALQKRGAARSELDAFIAQRLHDSVPARVAANRWLRTKFGAPERAAGADTPQPVGKGGAPRRVTPLQRAAPE